MFLKGTSQESFIIQTNGELCCDVLCLRSPMDKQAIGVTGVFCLLLPVCVCVCFKPTGNVKFPLKRSIPLRKYAIGTGNVNVCIDWLKLV